MRRSGRKPRWSQPELWSPGECPSGADLVPTSALLRHVSCPRVLNLVRQVRVFFPELDGLQIRVGLTRRAAGLAAREEPSIWINPYRLTRHTIAHELIHLLQFRGFVPLGERSADLYALARHPVLADDTPWYLKVPRSMVTASGPVAQKIPGLLHTLARDALTRREQGHRTYLQWFEEELASSWKEVRRSVSRPIAPVQEALF